MIKLLIKVSLIGEVAGDSLELKLQKQFLVFLALFMSMGGLVWGVLSFINGLYPQGIIPFSYTIISIFNLIFLNKTKKFIASKNIQTLISLLLPFLFQFSLGGFASSGAIMYWSVLALMASSMLYNMKGAMLWLSFFVIFSIGSGLSEGLLKTYLKPASMPDFSLGFLILNITLISSIVYGLMIYVVKKQELTQKVLYQKQDKILSQNEELQSREEELTQNNEKLILVNEEITEHKKNLEKTVAERTKTLRESEEKLKNSLADTLLINNQLVTTEEELRQNIEELRVIQEQMRQAKENAEHANKAKSEFLANMSHEIRTPLNAIVGFSQILMKRGDKDQLPQDYMKQLSYIKSGGQNLSELINNILDLSKIESGKMFATIEPLNVKQLFQGIYHINKVKANEKKLKFSFDFDSHLPDVIKSDRTKLNQILMNLVGNAVKFTPPEKSVKMTATEEFQHLVFRVIDTGIGIEEKKKSIIFEAFEQADTTITRKYGGSGLGLAITKKMVTLLDGVIGFESELNKGTTFFVKIPLLFADEELKENDDFNFYHNNFSKDNVILIAEDNEVNRVMIEALFEEFGLKVHFAVNGLQAVEMTRKLKPDIVLMDMHMPVMGGIEASKIIRKIPEFEDLPIIALSADAFAEQQKFAISEGLTNYVTKPIDFKKLMPILCEFLKKDKIELVEIENEGSGEMSQEIKDELNNELLALSEIPIFNFEEIDEQIAKIQQLAKGYDTEIYEVLKKMEDAFFAGDEDELKELFKFRL